MGASAKSRAVMSESEGLTAALKPSQPGVFLGALRPSLGDAAPDLALCHVSTPRIRCEGCRAAKKTPGCEGFRAAKKTPGCEGFRAAKKNKKEKESSVHQCRPPSMRLRVTTKWHLSVSSPTRRG